MQSIAQQEYGNNRNGSAAERCRAERKLKVALWEIELLVQVRFHCRSAF